MAPVQARERTSQVEAEKLKGRVAFVTGGTRGIGAAIGRSFAMQGATVAAGYSSNEEAARAFKEELEGFGVPASIHRGDVASYEDCQRTMHHVLEQHGRLDILVNNAGITADKSILKMEEDDWYKVLGVNLSGAFFTSKTGQVDRPIVSWAIQRCGAARTWRRAAANSSSVATGPTSTPSPP